MIITNVLIPITERPAQALDHFQHPSSTLGKCPESTEKEILFLLDAQNNTNIFSAQSSFLALYFKKGQTTH